MADAVDLGGATLYSWGDVLSEQLNPFFTRQFVHGEQAMLAKIALKKGCVVPMHQHHNEQISLILSGPLEFIIGGVSKTVKAGEILVILGGTIPEADIPALKEKGVAAVFGPGTPLDTTVQFIREHVKPRTMSV